MRLLYDCKDYKYLFNCYRQISDTALEAGAPVDDRESEDNTLFHEGISVFHRLCQNFIYSASSNLELLRALAVYLFDIGFSTNFIGPVGETPFLCAARWNMPQTTTCLKVLLENRASPTAKDNYDRGALHLAIECDNWEEEYHDELFMKEEEFVATWEGSDPSKGLEDKLLFLLHAGCDPAAEDNEGLTVRDYSEKHGLREVWEAALSRFKREQGLLTIGE